MIKINLNKVGKRFNREWIFRKVTLSLTSENKYVILGRNGSGKSTFLQTIAGRYETSDGTITYLNNENEISKENIHKELSICAPYLELFEDYTLVESIKLQSNFKPFTSSVSVDEIPELLQLESAKNKPIKLYSSGMKQRAKLGLAILADTAILMLDEPTNNLDKIGFNWYQKMIASYSANRLILVCSNDQPQEFEFCNKTLNIEDFKK